MSYRAWLCVDHVGVHGLPHDNLVEVLRKYGRIQE